MNNGYSTAVTTDREQQEAHPGHAPGCAPALAARATAQFIAAVAEHYRLIGRPLPDLGAGKESL